MAYILEINWFAVLVGAVLSYLLGALWFSPKAFGTAWMAAQPHRQPEDYGNCTQALAVQAVSTILLAVFTSWLLLVGGLAAIILFALTITIGHFSGTLFLGQPTALWWIPASYTLVTLGIIVVANLVL